MIVQQLSRLIGDVVSFVESAGASQKIIADLRKGEKCLETFASMSIEDFSQFLAYSEEYHRTGSIASLVAATEPKKTTRSKSPVKPKVEKLAGESGQLIALERFNLLLDRARRKELTGVILEEEMNWLDKALNKVDIIGVTKKLSIVGVKSKSEALKILKARALSQMEDTLNTTFG